MFPVRQLVKFSLKRFYSNSSATNNTLIHLKERSLIQVTGEDVSEYLQGLITNDIHHLDQGPGSMFTMFLNTKGRVLYDAIIYKTEQNNVYLIECDKDALTPLQKHLKLYKVRRKVKTSSLDDTYNVYALLDANDANSLGDDSDGLKQKLGEIVPCNKLQSTSTADVKIFDDLLIYRDPRVKNLGSRIISKVDINVKEKIRKITNITDAPESEETYKNIRYSLGVGEGVKDLPSGNCFPLECNCDYLHGISFHKGCYIGQELTARTHHTGVVRKRLMPLVFSKLPSKLPTENVILHENVNLGKLRGVQGNVGLALLRIKQALDFGEIAVGNGIAKVVKPSWWPIELTKEKIASQKN